MKSIASHLSLLALVAGASAASGCNGLSDSSVAATGSKVTEEAPDQAASGSDKVNVLMAALSGSNGGMARAELHVNLPGIGWTPTMVMTPPIADAMLKYNSESESNAVANEVLHLGPTPVLEVSGVDNLAEGTAPGMSVNTSAQAQVDEASLLNGLVTVQDLVTSVTLVVQSTPEGETAGTPSGTVYIQKLVIAGTEYNLGEIPPNTQLLLEGTLPVAGLGQMLEVPITGTVTLNEQLPLGANGLQVNAVRVVATGELAGLVKLDADIRLGSPNAQSTDPLIWEEIHGKLSEGESAPHCPATFQCPNNEPEGGMYYHPDTCEKLCKCSNGEAFEFDCPAHLHWSAEHNRCEWPHIAKCEDR